MRIQTVEQINIYLCRHKDKFDSNVFMEDNQLKPEVLNKY